MFMKINHRLTCPECGSHDVNQVYDEYTTHYFNSLLNCSCEDSGTANAAECDYHIVFTERVTEHGQFDEEGNWVRDSEEKEEIEREEIEDDSQVYCYTCRDEASEEDWVTEQSEPEESDVEYGESTYECSECGHVFD